jgi:GNAT superfamily N-acetyltransferase
MPNKKEPVLVIPLTANYANEVAALAADFYTEMELPGRPDPEHFAKTLKELILMGRAFGHIAVVNGRVIGGIAGLRAQDLVTGELYVQELFWFVLPSFRGAGLRLFRKYEDAIRHMGVRRSIFVHTVGKYASVLQKLYRRCGYVPLEASYYKEF